VTTCPSCGKDLPPGDFPFCPFCTAPLDAVPAAREQRKTVTVLFCDVTGSTALGESTDPEALRALLARYFERMKAAVESHGGTVEKFIGDAVMAVFGVPQVHEDDALRACRAAVEMRDALPELGVQARVGVNTGEVVTGTEERLATGDAVNVAARLEQAAQPGEILIGADTLALGQGAVETEEVEPLELKGKAESVRAHRLLAVTGEPVRSHDAPMVGRATELRRLRDAYEQAVHDNSCQLFTVLGTAGVGKSRLAYEFLDGLAATVVRGRCLSYGEGITYWPVVEVVKQLDAFPSDPVAAAPLRSLLGETDQGTSAEEIAWGFRKLLEEQAEATPVVCLFDDIHWGEETFLDLIEHVADLSREAPLLLLCMARPELLDARPSWGGGKLNATAVLLEPLTARETEALVEELGGVDDAFRDRILAAAEGNPLFVEEMLALVHAAEDGDIRVPPTIQALLAARLDQLEAHERAVLERGAVEGRIFHRGAVQALGPEERDIAGRLVSLVRKELVRPDKAQLTGDDAFRFRHLLIRDAAYDALPKSVRAELHERFADWLDEHGGLVELDEIAGYHLEQAYRCLAELGPTGDRAQRLAEQASERLSASGRQAYARADTPAAINLLERAIALLPSNDRRRVSLLTFLGRALMEAGDLARSDSLLSEAVERGREAGEHLAAADAAVARSYLRSHTMPEMSDEEIAHELQGVIHLFEEHGDEAGLARALSLAGMLRYWRGEAAAAIADLEQAASYARRVGDRAQEAQSLQYVLMATLSGPTTVHDALARVEEIRGRAESNRRLEVTLLRTRAQLEAMQGRFDRARDLLAQAKALAEELGLEVILASGVAHQSGYIELLAGDAAAAERALRPACEALERIGDWGHFAFLAPKLADALFVQGGNEAEALRLTELVERNATPGVADEDIGWRRVRAKLLASQGEIERAERLAREATARAALTDLLDDHAQALADLAEVLRLGGRPEESAKALDKAIHLYEQKGNVVAAKTLRALLAEPPIEV
jgi:class 3 adenylate cyclase/tetratricopeptide (TPR) repeat protein